MAESVNGRLNNKTKDYWDNQYPNNDLEKARQLNRLHKEKQFITKKEEHFKKEEEDLDIQEQIAKTYTDIDQQQALLIAVIDGKAELQKRKAELSRQKSDIEIQLQSFAKTVRSEARREREELLGSNKPVHTHTKISTAEDDLEKATRESLISIQQEEIRRRKEEMKDTNFIEREPLVRDIAAEDEEAELRRAMELSLEEDRKKQQNISKQNTVPPIHQPLDAFLYQMLNPNISQSQLLEKRRREAEEQERLELNRVEKMSQDQEYEESLAKDRKKRIRRKKKRIR